MALDRKGKPRDPEEAKVLLRLRIVSTIVVSILLVFAVVVDALGRLYVDPTFHIDSMVIGGLLGASLLSGGVSLIAGIKLPGGWEIKREDPKADH